MHNKSKINKQSSQGWFRRSLLTVMVSGALTGLVACGGGGGGSSPAPAPTPTPSPSPAPTPTPTSSISYTERTDSLPEGLGGRCMDGEAVDIDGDNDMDLILAIEFQRNILLTNNGGNFTLSEPFADREHDSEDMTVADFDGDGDPDVLFITEDDATNEFYLNQGGSFLDVSDRIPVGGKSNGVAALDANNDGHLDIVIGNGGTNRLLLNDGNANFTDHTDTVDMGRDVTQDVEVADIDGDEDLDVIFGNENLNRIFVNNGDGTFTDESMTRLPDISAETRDVDLGDVDGDGDLDMLVSNVAFFEPFPSDNYLLLNDGTGHFTQTDFEPMPDQHADSDFVDLDQDGDLDIVSGTAYLSEIVGRNMLMINDGTGVFSRAGFRGNGNVFDIIAADFTGDGKVDLYFCNRKGSQTPAGSDGGQDRYFTAD